MDRIDSWMKRVFKGKKTTGTPSTTDNKKKPFKPKKHKGPKRGKPTGRKPAGNHKRKSAPKPTRKPSPILKGKVKIIPLGGLDEVGKNMMAIEYEDDIIVIDMGFEFPSEDLLGIDYVVPDVTYLEDNKHRIRGVFVTHAHLDHIGGTPYVLPKIGFPPVYATKFTIGMMENRLEEFKLNKMAKLNVVKPEEKIKAGKMTVGLFRVAHSIPDCVGFIIDTPCGKIVHTGDFKFDETPARNMHVADIPKIKSLGEQNVIALLCESTNSIKPGRTISEKIVGETLENSIKECKGRVIVASFSSQMGRIQQLLDAAQKTGRKVFVSGRSMRTNISIAAKLGYLKFNKGDIKDIKKYQNSVPDNEALFITTGSQGEPVSALSRMAADQHPHLKLKKHDTVILSSSPIVGNEKAIFTVINNLCMKGVKVVHNQLAEVHTSGHAKQDELAEMISMIKPKYLVPIHGEYFMRQGLGELAMERCNITEDRIYLIKNGDVLLLDKDKRLTKSKETVETKYILIDGKGEGQLGSQVLSDREIMSQNGVLSILLYVNRKTGKIKGRPDVISRGFIYMHESDEIIDEIKKLALEGYKKIKSKNPDAQRRDIKRYIRQTVDKFTHRNLERRPLIVPIIVDA